MKKSVEDIINEIYDLLNKRGKDAMHDAKSLEKAKIKIKRLAKRKNKSGLGDVGQKLISQENLHQLDTLIEIYRSRGNYDDPNYDPLGDGGSSFLGDPNYIRRMIEIGMPNFIEDLARHFRILNERYLETLINRRIEQDKPPKKRNRPVVSEYMDSARESILKFRKDKSQTSQEYLKIDLKKVKLSAADLFKEMKKRGFIGSPGWVKKHFATITKLS